MERQKNLQCTFQMQWKKWTKIQNFFPVNTKRVVFLVIHLAQMLIFNKFFLTSMSYIVLCGTKRLLTLSSIFLNLKIRILKHQQNCFLPRPGHFKNHNKVAESLKKKLFGCQTFGQTYKPIFKNIKMDFSNCEVGRKNFFGFVCALNFFSLAVTSFSLSNSLFSLQDRLQSLVGFPT